MRFWLHNAQSRFTFNKSLKTLKKKVGVKFPVFRLQDLQLFLLIDLRRVGASCIICVLTRPLTFLQCVFSCPLTWFPLSNSHLLNWGLAAFHINLPTFCKLLHVSVNVGMQASKLEICRMRHFRSICHNPSVNWNVPTENTLQLWRTQQNLMHCPLSVTQPFTMSWKY